MLEELLLEFGVSDSANELEKSIVLHLDLVEFAFPLLGLFSDPPFHNRLALCLAALLVSVTSQEEGILFQEYVLESGLASAITSNRSIGCDFVIGL